MSADLRVATLLAELEKLLPESSAETAQAAQAKLPALLKLRQRKAGKLNEDRKRSREDLAESTAHVAKQPAMGEGSDSHLDLTRRRLLDSQRTVDETHALLSEMLIPGLATSRSGYLRSLEEILGRPPARKSWEVTKLPLTPRPDLPDCCQDEWIELRMETFRITGSPDVDPNWCQRTFVMNDYKLQH